MRFWRSCVSQCDFLPFSNCISRSQQSVFLKLEWRWWLQTYTQTDFCLHNNATETYYIVLALFYAPATLHFDLLLFLVTYKLLFHHYKSYQLRLKKERNRINFGILCDMYKNICAESWMGEMGIFTCGYFLTQTGYGYGNKLAPGCGYGFGHRITRSQTCRCHVELWQQRPRVQVFGMG